MKNLRKISTLDRSVILHGESNKILSYLRNFAIFLDGMKNSGKTLAKRIINYENYCPLIGDISPATFANQIVGVP